MQAFVREGFTLHYQWTAGSHARPSDPTLVLSNSLGTDLRIWHRLIPALQAHLPKLNILCYDKRGHGLSSVTPAPYQMDTHADDIIALIEHLGLQQVIFCGLSVGGAIAQCVAARQPVWLKALILCDTAHRIGTEDSWNTRINQVREQGLASIADAIMKVWFAKEYHQQHPELLTLWRQMLVNCPVEGYIGTCAALRDGDFTTSSAQLRLPTLCVVGEEDGSTPPALVQSTAELIGAELITLPNAAHIVCLEKPEALAAYITHFLQERRLV